MKTGQEMVSEFFPFQNFPSLHKIDYAKSVNCFYSNNTLRVLKDSGRSQMEVEPGDFFLSHAWSLAAPFHPVELAVTVTWF